MQIRQTFDPAHERVPRTWSRAFPLPPKNWQIANTAFAQCLVGSIASFRSCGGHFRSTPIDRHPHEFAACRKGARSRLLRCAKRDCYSNTSSARASNAGGTVRPSALAVLRLILSSIFVDCWTGISEGFSPLRILPVYTPASRVGSATLLP